MPGQTAISTVACRFTNRKMQINVVREASVAGARRSANAALRCRVTTKMSVVGQQQQQGNINGKTNSNKMTSSTKCINIEQVNVKQHANMTNNMITWRTRVPPATRQQIGIIDAPQSDDRDREESHRRSTHEYYQYRQNNRQQMSTSLNASTHWRMSNTARCVVRATGKQQHQYR